MGFLSNREELILLSKFVAFLPIEFKLFGHTVIQWYRQLLVSSQRACQFAQRLISQKERISVVEQTQAVFLLFGQQQQELFGYAYLGGCGQNPDLLRLIRSMLSRIFSNFSLSSLKDVSKTRQLA